MIHFPPDHVPASWGTNTFMMVADGNLIPLKSGGLLMLLYGDYASGETVSANPAEYSIVAVISHDGGENFEWLSTVSHGAPAPCDKPSEHDCTYLQDGTLYVFVWFAGPHSPAPALVCGPHSPTPAHYHLCLCSLLLLCSWW